MLNSAGKSRKVALSGAGGFLGSHLVPLLLKKKHKLTCLVRSSSKRKRPDAGATVITGDCSDFESMRKLLKDQDVFIHMASLLFGCDWQSYLRANAGTARNIVNAWRSLKAEERPESIIFISSLAAAGPCGKSPGISESAVPAPVSAYGWSKLLCENILQSGGFDRLLIFRPPIIYGSGDLGLLPMFKSAKAGIGISPGQGREFPVSVIHARDMARAICLGMEHEAAGLFHINDGQEHTMSGLCAAMGRALGRSKPVTLHMPLPIMGITAAASTFFGELYGAMRRVAGFSRTPQPRWNVDKFREARQSGWLAEATLIKKTLNFEPQIRLEEGMAEAVSGYRRDGLL